MPNCRRKKRSNPPVQPNTDPACTSKTSDPVEEPTKPEKVIRKLQIVGKVNCVSLSLCQMTELTSLNLSNNVICKLPSEISQLTNLIHLNVSKNKLRSIPNEIGAMFALRELILSGNLISQLPFELSQLFNLRKLDLTGNPLVSEIMNLVKRRSYCAKDILRYLVHQHCRASSDPPPRPWIQFLNQSPQSSCSLKLMTYNILSDKLATKDLNTDNLNMSLDWTYRKNNILKELIQYNADIVSLQEIEAGAFYEFFLPSLKKEGYDGLYYSKARKKKFPIRIRKRIDGCAILYKSDKFFLLQEYFIEFNDSALVNEESFAMPIRVMSKDNISLAVLLQIKEGVYGNRPYMNQESQYLLVCSTHIHWAPRNVDVKLVQSIMLMQELKRFVTDILNMSDLPDSQKSDPNVIPLLLCGDFNSIPGSGVVEFLSSGRLSATHKDFQDLDYIRCLSQSLNPKNENEFDHPFEIQTAYKNGIMPFTNFSKRFSGVLDHIFYSKQHFDVVGVLGPMNLIWLQENHIHGSPNEHIPSDHFPLVVEIKLKRTIPLQLHLNAITPSTFLELYPSILPGESESTPSTGSNRTTSPDGKYPEKDSSC